MRPRATFYVAFMQLPLVTVIIPTFNRRQWISICLDSIKTQTYPHIETLVIDDASTDGTVAWLKSQPDYSFARVHEQPKNGGASVPAVLDLDPPSNMRR